MSIEEIERKAVYAKTKKRISFVVGALCLILLLAYMFTNQNKDTNLKTNDESGLSNDSTVIKQQNLQTETAGAEKDSQPAPQKPDNVKSKPGSRDDENKTESKTSIQNNSSVGGNQINISDANLQGAEIVGGNKTIIKNDSVK